MSYEAADEYQNHDTTYHYPSYHYIENTVRPSFMYFYTSVFLVSLSKLFSREIQLSGVVLVDFLNCADDCT